MRDSRRTLLRRDERLRRPVDDGDGRLGAMRELLVQCRRGSPRRH
jgi:hypothetical protein